MCAKSTRFRIRFCWLSQPLLLSLLAVRGAWSCPSFSLSRRRRVRAPQILGRILTRTVCSFPAFPPLFPSLSFGDDANWIWSGVSTARLSMLQIEDRVTIRSGPPTRSSLAVLPTSFTPVAVRFAKFPPSVCNCLCVNNCVAMCSGSV